MPHACSNVFHSTSAQRHGCCRVDSYFVIFVIDAPGAVLSNNTSELLLRIVNRASHCHVDMGDGKEGERQPLLKNENVTYSSHGSDAIGISAINVQIRDSSELTRPLKFLDLGLGHARMIARCRFRGATLHRISNRAGRAAATLSVSYSKRYANGDLQSLPGNDRYFRQEGSTRRQVLSM